ncbi:MAG: hypothetical protein FWF28_00840 [Micrococcales bacterium]|nr:hypothetical protein [Micrococcales bacterium]
MHDPLVVVFDIRYPWWRRDPGGWRYHKPLVTVWHREPGEADSNTVCTGMDGSRLSWHNLAWAARHLRHLHFQVHPAQQVRHYFVRCADCGQRMGRCQRIGTWDGDEVYHFWCHDLRHTRAVLADFQEYVRGDADPNARWRVEHWLDQHPLVPDDISGLDGDDK